MGYAPHTARLVRYRKGAIQTRHGAGRGQAEVLHATGRTASRTTAQLTKAAGPPKRRRGRGKKKKKL